MNIKYFNLSELINKLLYRLSGYKTCIISCFITGFMAHGFFYFNTLFNHDGVSIYQNDELWKLSLGRCFIGFYRSLRNPIGAPFLEGLITLLFISVISICTCSIFKIKNRLYQLLISALLATSHVLSLLNATYIQDVDSYILAACLFTLSATICIKISSDNVSKKRKIIWFLISSALICFGLGLYQAYVTVFPLLLMMKAGVNCLSKKVATNDNFKLAGLGISSLISGGIVYAACLSALLKKHNVTLSNYHNGLSSLKDLSLENTGSSLIGAYRYYFSFIFTDTAYHKVFLSIILCLILLVANIIILRRKICLANKVQLILIELLFPFASNAVYLISGGYFHGLMVFQYVFLIIWILLLTKKCGIYNLKKLITVITILGIIFNNIVFANDLYLLKKIQYDNTHALFTRIITRAEELDGFVPGKTSIAFFGDIYDSPLTRQMDAFNDLTGKGLIIKWSVTSSNTIIDYMSDIYNYPSKIYAFTVKEMVPDAFNLNMINEMPVFPAKGSIIMDDGVCIVKISEVQKASKSLP